MTRLLAAVLGLFIIVSKIVVYALIYQNGWDQPGTVEILERGTVRLLRFIAGTATSLVLVGLGTLLVMYAAGSDALREKAAKFLTPIFTSQGMTPILLLMLLFLTLVK